MPGQEIEDKRGNLDLMELWDHLEFQELLDHPVERETLEDLDLM